MTRQQSSDRKQIVSRFRFYGRKTLPPIEIQRRLIQIGLYGNRVTGVQHVTKLCRQFENGRPDSRHTMEGCERNTSGGNDFLAADATLGRSQIQL
jgi:hypothetical protein